MDNIFIISLKRLKERQDKIIQFFQKNNIKYRLWYGVDGKKENVDKYNISRKKIQRFWHNYVSCCSYTMILSDTEYACALSHIKLYEYIVENNIPLAIIFEDDVYPLSNFQWIQDNLQLIKEKTNFEILFFYFEDKLTSYSKPININGYEFSIVGVPKLDWLINRRRVVYLTGCYAISLEGAKKLLDKAYPVRMPADTLTGLIAYNKLKSYKCLTKVVTSSGMPSTLERIIKVRPWYKKINAYYIKKFLGISKSK